VPAPRRPFGARRGYAPSPSRPLGASRSAQLASRRPLGSPGESNLELSAVHEHSVSQQIGLGSPMHDAASAEPHMMSSRIAKRVERRPPSPRAGRE
jgi:hypothetical protein